VIFGEPETARFLAVVERLKRTTAGIVAAGKKGR